MLRLVDDGARNLHDLQHQLLVPVEEMLASGAGWPETPASLVTIVRSALSGGARRP